MSSLQNGSGKFTKIPLLLLVVLSAFIYTTTDML